MYKWNHWAGFYTISLGWSLVYIEGSHSQGIIFKFNCMSFSEDCFCISKQCIPRRNAALCGISSGAPLFAKVHI